MLSRLDLFSIRCSTDDNAPAHPLSGCRPLWCEIWRKGGRSRIEVDDGLFFQLLNEGRSMPARKADRDIFCRLWRRWAEARFGADQVFWVFRAERVDESNYECPGSLPKWVFPNNRDNTVEECESCCIQGSILPIQGLCNLFRSWQAGIVTFGAGDADRGRNAGRKYA